MSPHAVTPDGQDSTVGQNLAHTRQNMNSNEDTNNGAPHSCLQRTDDDEIHDLVCVGFGPASLAIAVALHDAIEAGQPSVSLVQPSVRFLEKQPRFAWHAGMLLPGAKMQITFIKDLATLRNPRSRFTFLNYLHLKNRLVAFTNLSTFLPKRIEYEDYMRWAAEQFSDVVDYGQAVESVEVDRTNAQTGAVECFSVKSLDEATGHRRKIKAKNVCIAVGGRPNIPKCLDASHPRIIHSSQYATSIPKLISSGYNPKSVAVIGSGQSAAEVFHNIPSKFPGARSYLLIRGAALRPSDDSPFVNEIFDPSRVDDVYSQASGVRAEGLALDRGTNYGVVRLELLEEIYSDLYSHRIQYESEDKWPQRILPHRIVTGMQDVSRDGRPAIQLQVQNDSGDFQAGERSANETLDVDLVIVACGYQRNAHESMLQELEHLKPDGKNAPSKWDVNRNYSVKFRDHAVQPNAGIWLQGCNESTHGLSDTLLSILATRGGGMVESIFGSRKSDD